MNAVAVAAAATTVLVGERKPSSIIDLETLSELLEGSQVLEKTDLGAVMLYRARHPERGTIILVNTAGDHNAVLYV